MSPGRVPSKQALQHSFASGGLPLADMDRWSRLSPSDGRTSVGDWNRSMNGNLAYFMKLTYTRDSLARVVRTARQRAVKCG